MTVRPAIATDAPAICAIWNRVIRDTAITFTTVEKEPSQIEAMIHERGDGFLVAVQDVQVIGFATFGPFRSGPGYADVVEHSVYMTPEAQGSGGGVRLMEVLTKAAASQGKRIMVACLTGDNETAQAFHAKLGFEEVGFMPEVGQKFGKRRDLRWMQKKL